MSLFNAGVPEALKRLAPRGFRDLAAVMSGALTRNVFRGVFKILIAGQLAPQAMGILRSVFSLFKITTSLVELGLDYAMVTFVSAAIRRKDDDEKDRLLKTVLMLKLAVAAGLVIVGNLIAPWLSRVAFSDPTLTIWVRLIFLAVGGQLLWRYISSYLSAHQQFGRLGFFFATMPILMLATAAILIVTGRFDLSTGILIYLFTPAVTVVLWWPFLDKRFLGARSRGSGVVGRILRFSRWVHVSSITSASRAHLNPLLLKNPHLSGSMTAGEVNAGLYGFGSDLAAEISVFSQSLLTVLLPKASGRLGPRELKSFVRRSYRYLALVIVPIGLLVFVAKPMLLLLGHFKASYLEYLPSLRVFYILYTGALFSVLAIPIQTALYSMNLPHMETYMEILMVTLLIGGGIVLIPRYGCEGAAMTVFVQRALSFFILLAYGLFKLNRWDPETT